MSHLVNSLPVSFEDNFSDDLMADNGQWMVAAYDFIPALEALIGAFWGMKVSLTP